MIGGLFPSTIERTCVKFSRSQVDHVAALSVVMVDMYMGFGWIVRWMDRWFEGRDGAAVSIVTPCCERNEVVTCTNTIIPTPL